MPSEPSLIPALIRIDRSSIRDLALDQLRAYITSGAVASGERLPAERDLAQRLGVGRNSVREALKILEAIGIVESRVGEGTFIADRAGASIGRTIGLSLATWGGTLIEILEARQMIEVEACRVAARAATALDLAAISDQLTRMERADDVAQAYITADMQFHRLVARATQNGVVAGIVSNLIDLLEEVLREARADQIQTLSEGGTGAMHRDIYDGLARGDGDAASETMRRHLKFSTDLWATLTSLGGGTGPANSLDVIEVVAGTGRNE